MTVLAAELRQLASHPWEYILAGRSGEHMQAEVSVDEATGLAIAAITAHPREDACVAINEAPLRAVVFRWARTDHESEAWKALQHAISVANEHCQDAA